MRTLRGKLKISALSRLKLAEKEARRSMCENTRNGAVIIWQGHVIGRGFNSPPLNKKEFQTCLDEYSIPKEKVKFDRTCCMHAEWRAVMDALKNHPRHIRESKLYHVRLDERGEVVKMDKPFCTTCSRIMLDAGIKEIIVYHQKGIRAYPAGEFNRLSYKFFKSK